MKISFTSLTFKTLSLLFMSSIIFIIFIVVIAKESFSQGYTYLIQEDIISIEKKISPEIAMILSYGLNNDLKRVATNHLKHNKILLLKIDSVTLEKPMLFSKKNKSIK